MTTFLFGIGCGQPLEKGKPEHGEGIFYVWTTAEIEQVLGKETASIFNFRYGVEAGGNVPSRQDIEGWLKDKNVLYENHSLAETSKKFGKTAAENQPDTE